MYHVALVTLVFRGGLSEDFFGVNVRARTFYRFDQLRTLIDQGQG